MAFGTSFMMLGNRLFAPAHVFHLTNMTIAQLCGITFGLAIASAVFVNDAKVSIMAALPSLSDQQVQSAIEGATGQLFRSLDTQSQSALSNALVTSLRKT